jgi:hypothetical protein
MWEASSRGHPRLDALGEEQLTVPVAIIGSASISRLPSEFDDFLFAPICEDKRDMPISVLSALARLDVDPWQEAALLAQSPGAKSTERLAAYLAALPGGLSVHMEPKTVAARLITLLPRRTGVPSAPRRMSRCRVTAAGSKMALYVLLCMISLVLILSLQHIIANGQLPTIQ